MKMANFHLESNDSLRVYVPRSVQRFKNVTDIGEQVDDDDKEN